MPDAFDALLPGTPGLVPADLNQSCFCITINRKDLGTALGIASGDADLSVQMASTHPHLFSNVPVFLPAAALDVMLDTVAAIEAMAQIPAFRNAVMAWAPPIARHDPGPAGALMGYDFHLGEDSPKLIEVNTNAGGAFLNALLARAQSLCCAELVHRPADGLTLGFEAHVLAMFRAEWRRQRRDLPLHRIAIIDDTPEAQYLYPEFVLAQQMLTRAGIEAVICDPGALEYRDAGLFLGELPIDLVYNRLVDFALAEPGHAALRRAYQDGTVVLTPNPHNHALLAHKRNLTLLSDPVALGVLGVDPALIRRLAGIPQTQMVTPQNADALWSSRRQLFFKPVSGHGGKAVYRGDKLTKSVWADILAADYVAQTIAAPGQRMIRLDGQPTLRKVDVRLYTYAAQPLLVAARIYQGQTTNFRTPGGGFAPVLIV